MSRTLKALSALLTYPTAELQEAAAEIGMALSAASCFSSAATLTVPLAATTANSAAWPRRALIARVR